MKDQCSTKLTIPQFGIGIFRLLFYSSCLQCALPPHTSLMINDNDPFSSCPQIPPVTSIPINSKQRHWHQVCIFPQIDQVGNPSWQAQIKGAKKWTLEPPPECAHTCHSRMEVVVNPGEISEFISLPFKSTFWKKMWVYDNEKWWLKDSGFKRHKLQVSTQCSADASCCNWCRK
jgi:hypothetical protein